MDGSASFRHLDSITCELSLCVTNSSNIEGGDTDGWVPQELSNRDAGWYWSESLLYRRYLKLWNTMRYHSSFPYYSVWKPLYFVNYNPILWVLWRLGQHLRPCPNLPIILRLPNWNEQIITNKNPTFSELIKNNLSALLNLCQWCPTAFCVKLAIR